MFSVRGRLRLGSTVWPFFLLAVTLVDSNASFAQAITFSHDLSVSDLPAGTEKTVPIGSTASETKALLDQQPTVIIDSATLTLGEPTLGTTRVVSLNRLELRHGARIVTNGIYLQLNANQLVSDSGKIIAFDGPNAKVSGIAPVGQNGAPGLNAGTVVLYTEINDNDVLHVVLNGQGGQAAGGGVAGAPGAPGPRGGNGADHLADCAHGAGTGGSGTQGAQGGGGGSGGPGGDGGSLILRGEVASQRSQIDFSAVGGIGGPGGNGGHGGAGGPGGAGGARTFYCGPGAAGQMGAQGSTGVRGEDGAKGGDGRISANL